MQLGTFGVWIGRALPEHEYGSAARLAQELGFGALWFGGSPRLSSLRPMLESSETLVVATGIVNVWQYEARQLAEEFAELESSFPGRVLVGIGIGHREVTERYTAPLAKMREFLDALAAATKPIPRERMVLAALGPQMLRLSAERTLGSHPYFTPPAHTRLAREILGPHALLAPEQAVVLTAGDPAADRSAARRYAALYLGLSNYRHNLVRLGYRESDLADGGSTALIDELVPQGPAALVAESVSAHLEAGADHVCVQAVGVDGVPEREWRALAAALSPPRS